MTVLLDKLPYKRIPTDCDRYQAPLVLTLKHQLHLFPAEQPRIYSIPLKGVSVL